MKEEYRKRIIEMVQNTQSEKILAQIYTILFTLKLKAGD